MTASPLARYPLRPDLWEIVLPAVTAGIAAAKSHLQDHIIYLPRQDVPRYKESDKGWPATVRQRLGRSEDGPLDWPSLFTTNERNSIQVHIDDVPALVEAVARAIAISRVDDEFLHGVSDLATLFKDDGRLDSYVTAEFLGLVGDIMNRAAATGAESEAELREIYLDLEFARFSPRLRGDALVPILLIDFASREPVHLESNVWLEPLDVPTQQSRAMDWMANDVSAYVAAAATHALVFRDVEIDNPRFDPERFVRDRASQIDLSIVDALLQCVTIHEERSTGYAQVMIRPNGWANTWTHDLPPLMTEWSGRRYPESLDRARLDRQRTPMSAASLKALAKMTLSLRGAPKNVQLAAKRSWRVTYRDDVEDQIIDCTIGIEALVGRDRDELVHRMSQRAAAALAHSYPPQNIYTVMKQVYGHRSTIVHGGTPKNSLVRLGDHTFTASSTAVRLLRWLLEDYLLSDKPWTPESLDQGLLHGLEREGGYPPSEEGAE